MNPVETAVAYFEKSYLCSQSVLMAYAPSLGITSGMAARIGAPFGAGVGHMGLTCGAVSGALVVIGLTSGHENPEDIEGKKRMYTLVQEFVSSFEARNGSIVCRELLGHNIGTPDGLASVEAKGWFDTKCPGFVRDAAEIVGQILEREDRT